MQSLGCLTPGLRRRSRYALVYPLWRSLPLHRIGFRSDLRRCAQIQDSRIARWDGFSWRSWDHWYGSECACTGELSVLCRSITRGHLYVRVYGATLFIYGIAMASVTLLLYSVSLPFQTGLTSAIAVNNLFFLATAIILSATSLCVRAHNP